jgi:hypothetical protein
MKEATVIFFGSWKFAATFPMAIFGMNMTAAETILYTNLGGIIGVFLFARFWDVIIQIWNRIFRKNRGAQSKQNQSSGKKVFTKRNRRIVNLKSKYGLTGIIVLNPILLSIPVASFLVAKYYGNKTKNLLYLVAGQVAWSLLYTIFYFQVYSLL